MLTYPDPHDYRGMPKLDQNESISKHQNTIYTVYNRKKAFFIKCHLKIRIPTL